MWLVFKDFGPCDKDKQGHKNALAYKNAAKDCRKRPHRFAGLRESSCCCSKNHAPRTNQQQPKTMRGSVWNLLCIRPVVHICSVIKSVNSRMNKTSPKGSDAPPHPHRPPWQVRKPAETRKLLSVSVSPNGKGTG